MSASKRIEPGRVRRPWYCSDRAIDEYRSTLTDDSQPLPMLKTLKITRTIIVNLGIIALGIYSLRLGADPTLVGAVAIITLGGYNGIEISDYLALLQAYRETQADSGNDDSS